MRIPYGFELISGGTLEVNKDEANIVCIVLIQPMCWLTFPMHGKN